MGSKMLNNLSHYCWLNIDVMKKWEERYEDAKASKKRERGLFCTRHGPQV